MISPIDGLSMEGVQSIQIHHATDYAGEKRAIRWTECFFIKNEDHSNPRFEPVDQSRLAETLAQACCIALTKHLDALKEAGKTKIGLRATIDAEQVRLSLNFKTLKLVFKQYKVKFLITPTRKKNDSFFFSPPSQSLCFEPTFGNTN